MNWVRENKFLTGFIAILVIGTGALGYLLYTAWGAYSDVTDQYTAQAAALQQLQTRAPYPDQKNLKAYRVERDKMIEATHSLATQLSRMVLPVDPMTPSAFQDKLRDTLSDVTAEAAQYGVALPEDFTMDFKKYQTSPPAADAAAPLGRQLAALKIVVDILIHEHVDSVVSLERAPLPQEGAATSGRSESQGRFRRGGGGGGGEEESSLVEKYPFQIQFTANQPAFQKVLNDISASSKQFFVTRTLLVDNSDPKPVAKAAASPSPTPGQVAATPAPGTPDTSGTDTAVSYLKFVVGTEKLDVSMRIDMVAFNPPPAHQ